MKRESIVSRVLILIAALSLAVGVSLVGCQWGEDTTVTAEAQTPETDAYAGLVTDPTPAADGPDAPPVSVTDPTYVERENTPEDTSGVLVEVTEREPVIEPVVAASYEEGEALYRRGRYDEATDVFARYVSAHPDNVWGHYMLGLSAWKSGDEERAERSLLDALDRDGDHIRSRVNLGRVLIDAGRPGEAVPHLRHVLDLDPNHVSATRVLGRAHGELGDAEAAQAAYRRAIALDGGDVWSMNNLGLILIHQGRFEEALGPLARAVELSEDQPTFRNNLGIALERTGYLRAAATTYAGAVAADSSYARAAANLARVEMLSQDPAIGAFDLTATAAAFVTGMRGIETDLASGEDLPGNE